MSFRSVFVAVVIAFALIVSAFLVNRQRPGPNSLRSSGEWRASHRTSALPHLPEASLGKSGLGPPIRGHTPEKEQAPRNDMHATSWILSAAHIPPVALFGLNVGHRSKMNEPALTATHAR